MPARSSSASKTCTPFVLRTRHYSFSPTLGEFEGARSGWEQVIKATHPPIELRLERLE